MQMPWPQAAPLSPDTPSLFLVATLVQHRRRMPLFTDRLRCGETIRQIKEKLGGRLPVAPMQCLRSSHRNLGFGSLRTDPPKRMPSIHRSQRGHAREFETSTTPRLAPHLVGDDRNAKPGEFGKAFPPPNRARITKDQMVPGRIGYPHLALAENEEGRFRAFPGDVIAHFEHATIRHGKGWDL